MIINTVAEASADFEFFQENYPPVRHLIMPAIVIVWLISSVGIYRFDKKIIINTKNNTKKHDD